MRVFFLLILFPLILAKEKDYCSVKYRCLRHEHVLCKYSCYPGPQCRKGQLRLLTTAEKKKILQAHNVMRHETALQYNASNMLTVGWSKELAKISQRLVMQCLDLKTEFVCLPTEIYPKLTINSRHASLSPYLVVIEWLVLCNSYFKMKPERIHKHVTVNHSTNDEVQKLPFYTLAVWAKVRKNGCGIVVQAKSGLSTFDLLCLYYPPGNVEGKPVFKIAEYGKGPASNCPKGYRRNINYTGLCIKADEYMPDTMFEDPSICKSNVSFSSLFFLLTSLLLSVFAV